MYLRALNKNINLSKVLLDYLVFLLVFKLLQLHTYLKTAEARQRRSLKCYGDERISF